MFTETIEKARVNRKGTTRRGVLSLFIALLLH